LIKNQEINICIVNSVDFCVYEETRKVLSINHFSVGTSYLLINDRNAGVHRNV